MKRKPICRYYKEGSVKLAFTFISIILKRTVKTTCKEATAIKLDRTKMHIQICKILESNGHCLRKI